MKIIIISSMGKKQLKACLNSLYRSTKKEDLDIDVIKEVKFREVTLNKAVERNKGRDLFIVGDDIIFTKGWDEALNKYRNKADIIGFSMLYPGTNMIQDNGYDLVKLDDKIDLMPKYRGLRKGAIKVRARRCDALCGCAMFIKKEVFKKVPKFSLDGQNRWGESIFTITAKKKGFRVMVLDHFLYHQGKSTKVNKKLKYRTISYLYEKKIWSKIIKKYIPSRMIKISYMTMLSNKLRDILNSKEKILVYGIGTVANTILKFSKNKNIDFCTGLKEETGLVFNGRATKYYKNVNFKKYGAIIISPINMGEKIYNMIKAHLYDKNRIYFMCDQIKGQKIIYELKKI